MLGRTRRRRGHRASRVAAIESARRVPAKGGFPRLPRCGGAAAPPRSWCAACRWAGGPMPAALADEHASVPMMWWLQCWWRHAPALVVCPPHHLGSITARRVAYIVVVARASARTRAETLGPARPHSNHARTGVRRTARHTAKPHMPVAGIVRRARQPTPQVLWPPPPSVRTVRAQHRTSSLRAHLDRRYKSGPHRPIDIHAQHNGCITASALAASSHMLAAA